MSIERITKPINVELKEFNEYYRNCLKTSNKLLNIVLNYVVKNNGKQLRPILVLLSAKMIGDINKKTYVSAAMIELLHTATLIHDDVVDNSQLRRSVFSIKALWKAKLAVLVGDFLLALGLKLAVENNAFDILEIVSNTVQLMAEGELIQIEKSRRLNINEETYYEIIKRKTATLIMASIKSGGLSVTDNQRIIELYEILGTKLGIAFQIKDDLLDYEGTNLIGKPIGNDIQESKITLPLIYSLQNSEKSEKNKILKILSKKRKSNTEVEIVRNFVFKKGGIEYTKKALNQYITESKKIIEDEFLASETKDSMNELIEYIANRKK